MAPISLCFTFLLVTWCCSCCCVSSYRGPDHIVLPKYAQVQRLIQVKYNYTAHVAAVPHGSGSADVVWPSEVQHLVGQQQQLLVPTLGSGIHQRMLKASRPLQPPFNVCLSPWIPFVTCTPGSTQHHQFTGYQVELFRKLALCVGWAPSDYFFSCDANYTNLLTDVLSPAGNCSIAATGVLLDPSSVTSGTLQFSWPTYKSGMRIMFTSKVKVGSMWAYLKGFHWSIWMTLPITAVTTGLLIAAIEWVQCKSTELDNPQVVAKGLAWQEWLWFCLARLTALQTHMGDPSSDAARLLYASYSFFMLIIVSLYIGASAGTLTEKQLLSPYHIEGPEDLKGLKVGTYKVYAPYLQRLYNISNIVELEWENDNDTLHMVELLRAHQFDALVLDGPVLEHIAATNDVCDLFITGPSFMTFGISLAFPSTFDPEVVQEFSEAIVLTQAYFGGLEQYEQAFIKLGGETNECLQNSVSHEQTFTIRADMVSGLYIQLFLCITVSFVLLIIHNIRNDPKQRAAAQRIMGSMTGGWQLMKSFSGHGSRSFFSSISGSVPGQLRTSRLGPALSASEHHQSMRPTNSSHLPSSAQTPQEGFFSTVARSVDSFTHSVHWQDQAEPTTKSARLRAFIGAPSFPGYQTDRGSFHTSHS